MSERMLRGRAALTIVRGNTGSAGRHVYFSQLVDPRDVDPADRDRLVAENYLDWVVPDGDGWKLAEPADSGEAGDPVTVGSAAMLDPGPDPGLVNAGTGSPSSDTTGSTSTGETEADADTEAKTAAEAEARREAARAKLPADGSAPTLRHGEDVWVEYAVSQGYDRDAAEKAGRDELVKLFGKSK